MIWPGKITAKFIKLASEEQVQPNGVDLTIGEIFMFEGMGTLGKKKIFPSMKQLKPDENGYYNLKRGEYLVRYREIVQVPENAIGLVFPRSTLQRMGAIIYTSVWDSGYKGRGVGLLVVFNRDGIRIHKDARICQIVFMDARPSGLYKGSYLFEGIKDI